jgi:hypothetical protein
MKYLPLLAAFVLLAGCGERVVLESELKAIRSYSWPATVVDPAPDWNPASYVLVARSEGGFSLLEEGGLGERRFASENRRESNLPRWINAEQFVFGPAYNARRAPDGTVSTPSDGLTVVTLTDGSPQRVPLSDRGFRPQPSGGGRIVAQEANRILFIDSHGHIEEFGEGFDTEAQRDGPGLCWRDTPAFEPDWWTGRRGHGVMHVRWRPGKVDDVPGGMQAAWTRHGEVLCTVQDAPPADGQPWWSGGTSLLLMPGPGLAPVPGRTGARDPAPHPLADLMAWTGADGGIWMGTIRPDGWSERIAVSGSQPRWSYDGLRLCWLGTPANGSQLPTINVTVLSIR